MFTGIVQATGRIEAREARGDGVRLRIGVPEGFLARTRTGDSIAVAGVCLTVTEFDATGFSADVSRETLELTTLEALGEGANVNLEPALRVGDPLGGHWVSGHVDGRGQVLRRRDLDGEIRLTIAAPSTLAPFLARKGSVTVDGVSLTVNDVDGARFDICLVPHTLAATTLDGLRDGSAVNLEIDIMARYASRLLEHRREGGNENHGTEHDS